MVVYPQVRAPLYTRLEEAPRLRGHSKFSGLFRQRRESPSKLMLLGHAISGRSNCSIFLACSYISPLFLFNHRKTKKKHIYYTCRDPREQRVRHHKYMVGKVVYRVKINILQNTQEKKDRKIWRFITMRPIYLKCPREKFSICFYF